MHKSLKRGLSNAALLAVFRDYDKFLILRRLRVSNQIHLSFPFTTILSMSLKFNSLFCYDDCIHLLFNKKCVMFSINNQVVYTELKEEVVGGGSHRHKAN